jgi:type I restriction enzyme S subunit
VSWPLVKLGEVCKFVRGPFGGALKKECFVEDGFAVYEQQHAIYNQFSKIRYFVDESKFNELKRFKLNSGDLIMSCSGTMGKIAIVPDSIKTGIINQALLKLTPSEVIDLNYLKYWLESQSFQFTLNGMTHGAAIKNVASVAVLKEIEIPLPPLDEQKRIAAILDKADAIRRKRQQAIQLANDFLRSVFLDMFGDPNIINDRWDECCVADFGGNENNKRIPLKQADRDLRDGIYPYYGATGVIDHLDDYTFDGSYLLIAEDGKNLINRTKPLAFPAKGKFWVNNHSHVIGDTGKVNLTYLEYCLNLKNIRSHVTGIDQFKLNRTSLGRIKVFNPPLSLQAKFELIVEKTKQAQSTAIISQIESNNVFNSLSQKAFAGEL